MSAKNLTSSLGPASIDPDFKCLILDYNFCAIQKIASIEQRKDGRVQGRLSLCDTLFNAQRRKIFFNKKQREFP